MNWKAWIHGLISAVIGGAVGAVSSNWVDPNDFNIYTRKFWELVGATALSHAIAYLVRSPINWNDQPKVITDATANTHTS